MKCSVDGCNRDVKHKGLCLMHYRRERKWGDVNVVKKKTHKKRSYVMHDNYVSIELTKGKYMKVDREDFDKVYSIPWYYISSGYACHKNGKSVLAHRYITNAPISMCVDHINGDKLDNRKSNLRLCTHSQNNCNSNHGYGYSNYKGVYKRGNKWGAKIQFNKKIYNAGTWDTENEAAIAYNKKAIEIHGDFAYLNKIK